MELASLVRAYIAAKNAELPIGRELAARTCSYYFECEHVYSRYLRRAADVTDFIAERITAFLRSILDSGGSPYTAKARRTGLLVQWRFAHRCGLAPPCDGVRPVFCPPLPTKGYDVLDMQRLLAHVATLRGTVRHTGIPKAIYWESFLRTDWEVGMRVGDMLRVTCEQFDPSGWLWCAETKTHKAGWRNLRPSTAAAIATSLAANPNRDRIWPGYTRRNICRAFRLLATATGVGGTTKYIRSGGSSECDNVQPGSGYKHLRHSTPQVWEKHYRVDRICDRNRPLPPELAAFVLPQPTAR